MKTADTVHTHVCMYFYVYKNTVSFFKVSMALQYQIKLNSTP